MLLLTFALCCSYGTAPNSKTIKNSRLVSQKDDVHVCIMCLRAIMNYQVLTGDIHYQSHPHVTNNTQSNLKHPLFSLVALGQKR